VYRDERAQFFMDSDDPAATDTLDTVETLQFQQLLNSLREMLEMSRPKLVGDADDIADECQHFQSMIASL
jgi:hypothetical protein